MAYVKLDRRADFTSDDVAVLMMVNAGVIQHAGNAAVIASERFVALALDGFRSEGATRPAPTIATDADDRHPQTNALRKSLRRFGQV